MRKKMLRTYAQVMTGIAVFGMTTMMMWLFGKDDLLSILIVSAIFGAFCGLALAAAFELSDEYEAERQHADKRRALAESREEYEQYIIVNGIEIPAEDWSQRRA